MIDVCNDHPDVKCDSHSECMNAPDSEDGYRCICDSGYRRNGSSCSLIGIDIIYLSIYNHS